MKRSFSYSKIFTLLSLSILFPLLFAACSSSQQFISTRPVNSIKIDGKSMDWEGSLESFPKEQYSVGFKNDDKYLYLCFITSDRDKIIKIMRMGMDVVFDSPNDASKNYTIKFPVINPGLFRESVSVLGPDALQKEGISLLFQDMLDKEFQFDLIQNDIMNTIPLKNNENIEVKAGTTNELFILELKVPLASTDSSFPLGVLPGEKINIKFETVPSRIAFREAGNSDQNAPGGNSGGNARGGRGGGGRGGRGGNNQAAASGDMGGGGPVNMSEKFSTDFSIQLSK